LLRSEEIKEQKSKCPKCQKEYIASKSNEIGDKTTLTHDCSQKPTEELNDKEENNDEPQDNHDHDSKNIPEVGKVRSYCRDNEVKKLEYDEDTGKLVIIYKTDKPKKELTDLTEELEGIKEYLKEKGKKDKKKRYLTDND
jgi:hypothetical protein